ncbi:deubiquitinase OTU2 [Aspergillus clavatus NRRL 1]|uniref:OTU-like cysteine protease, putative n=1 Tax=Aspergillus clavatus (strain ATCC 1007 / CBS 513.65 / DSM 816 / NCTC 3887 / NRRL 1 / QM 1276 / 107) TaxID=344612 RepID=A1CIS4_ASPCL|nr:OTU-like cysteine protease, putative [Aspergillus clavatus NRRL 1]EAW10779.1 OTU-like cysteine protease, putative [Aspergillus clavatus NRRL 1]
MEELLARHRKEQKDLQGRITQKKKSATKKTRRGINEECDRLQHELSERHQAEIAELNGEPRQPVDGFEDLSLRASDAEDENTTKSNAVNGTDDTDRPSDSTASNSNPASETASGPRTKKPNRQKARLARRAAEQAAQAEIAAEEAAKQVDHRGNEREVMEGVFKRLGLKEIEINPDGHCLYSAIANQLEEAGLGLKPDPQRMVLQPQTQSRIDTVASPKHDGYRAVRAVAADFIVDHKDDFEAFMEEPLDQYTRKIKLTAEWGGQLELQAIARAYGININVIQGDGRIEKIEAGDADDFDEEEMKKRVIWLAYYRHTYGLGEHYNALTKHT